MSGIHDGQVVVKWQGHSLTVRFPDLRRAIVHLVFLTKGLIAERDPWNVVQNFIYSIGGTAVVLGWIHSPDGWMLSKQTGTYSDVFLAAMSVASCGLHVDCCTAVRLGHGIGRLNGMMDYEASKLCWWNPKEPMLLSTLECPGTQPLSLRLLFGEQHWQREHWIQFLMSDPDVVRLAQRQAPEVPHIGGPHLPGMAQVSESPARGLVRERPESLGSGSPPPAQAARTEPRGVSVPVPGSDSISVDDASIEDPMTSQDSFLTSTWEDVRDFIEKDTESAYVVVDDDTDVYVEESDEWAAIFYSPPPDHIYEIPDGIADDGDTGCSSVASASDPSVELEFDSSLAYLLEDLPRKLTPHEIAVQILYQSGKKTVVIERDTDLLTAEDVAAHAAKVSAAMLKELQTWKKYGCFSRKQRAQARNIIDTRWVLKWKYVDGERTIRARLTVRGFKDREGHLVATFAGTVTRWGQRLITATAAQRRWPLVSADIEKAFLQGMTYEEMARLTGEPMREVNFALPPGSIPLLRMVSGFNGFNPALEVCHCDKPGTGLKDAPAAFSKKLISVTQATLGCRALKTEPQIETKHVDGRLVLIFGKHVDDIKIAGEPGYVQWLLDELAKVFGELKVEWHKFDNCAITHCQNTETFEVLCDQNKYISALRPISSPLLTSLNSDEKAPEELRSAYLSLVGALAYATLTRADIAVFVAALQRAVAEPSILHLKRLNSIVRWAQRNPVAMRFQQLEEPIAVIGISDAAFKREEGSGRAMRGTLIVLAGPIRQDRISTCRCNLVEYYARMQRHVVRSTFAAELFSGTDTVDVMRFICVALHEVMCGALTALEARDLVASSVPRIRSYLVIDCMSIFTALQCQNLKVPAEKTLMLQLLWLQELLESGQLRGLTWCDTRDMSADGLGKGAVARDALRDVLAGRLKFHFETKTFVHAKQRRGVASVAADS